MELLSTNSKISKLNELHFQMEELINKKLQKYTTYLISQKKDVTLCDLAITSVAKEIVHIRSIKDILDRSHSISKIFYPVMSLPNSDIN